MRKKCIKSGICLLAAVLIMALNSFVVVKAAEQRVYDKAALFTDEEVRKLEKDIADMKERIGYDVVIVTTDYVPLNGTSMEYADDFYDNGDFGVGAGKSGVLFLIDMDNREIWISTCGEMIGILTDEKIDKILDRVYPSMPNGAYYSAAKQFLVQTEKCVNPPSKAGVGLVIGLLISGITWSVIAGKYRGGRQKENYAYQRDGRMHMVNREDRFLKKHVSQRKIPKSPPPQSRSSGSSSGRSTMHVSSSGRTHGGGGRKF